jgi:protein ImuB
MFSQGQASGADERERVACVELPALPLQLLLLDQPSWREHPVAVVEADRPQAKLVWVNEHARRLRVLPGMRFAAARSLAPQLRASVISSERIERAVSELFGVLINFSPRVEPGDVQQPGSFWIDPSGMIPLWGELGAWAMALQQAVNAAGFAATVIVGFHRFRCLAIARAQAVQASACVITDPNREARMAACVPLDRLGISARLRDDLAGLGVRTLGEFMALPGPELRVRFGVEAERLHQRGSDGHWAPMQARALVDPISERVELDPPEGDVTRLLFRIKPVLERLLGRLADRGSAMSALQLRLRLDHVSDHASGLEQRLDPRPRPSTPCRCSSCCACASTRSSCPRPSKNSPSSSKASAPTPARSRCFVPRPGVISRPPTERSPACAQRSGPRP